MDSKPAFRLSILLCGLIALACRDTTAPGCRGLACRPVTGIVISGSVVPPGNDRVAAIVHSTLFDPTIASGDSLDHCVGRIIRDTLVFTNAASTFHVLLLAGFPVFQGCLVIRATPDADSRLQPSVRTYPDLAFRDTSAHDTLYATIAVRP